MNKRTCAEDYAGVSHYWEIPHNPKEFIGLTYNIIIFEISGEGFCAKSADAVGLTGEGSTLELSVLELKRAMETRIEEKGGGVFLKTSSYEFQHKTFQILRNYWKKDNVKVLNCFESKLSLFLPENLLGICPL